MNWDNIQYIAKASGLALVFIALVLFGRWVGDRLKNMSNNDEIMFTINLCSSAPSIDSDACDSLAKYGIDAKLLRSNDDYFRHVVSTLNADTLSKADAIQKMSYIMLEYITPPVGTAGAAMIEKIQESDK